MLESTQAIIEYVDKQSLDDVSFGLSILQQKSPLGDDPLLISRNYDNIIYNLKFLVFYTLLAFILLNGFIWFLTCSLVNKKSMKNFFVYLFKFGLITLIFSVLIYLFTYSSLKSYLNPVSGNETSSIVFPLLITLALFYFMYVAFSLLDKIELKNLFKKLFAIGIKKAHLILLAYFIIILLVILFSSLLVYLIEKNIFLLIISIALFVFTFVWSRIFLVLVIGKLSD